MVGHSSDRIGLSRIAMAGLAQVVLALATGLPLRSTEQLVPRREDRNGPFLGI